MNMLLSFIIGFIAIGSMVFFHELGHFLAARAVGVGVEVFAVGWGKALFTWQGKNTEYRLNLLPIGGYCRLEGSDDLEQALDRGDNQFETLSPNSLFAVHPLKKLALYVSGPLANLLLALLLFLLFHMIGYQSEVDPNRILLVSDYPHTFQESSSAADGYLESGDTIVSVNGVIVSDFQQIQAELARSKGAQAVTFHLVRSDGRELDVSVVPLYSEAEHTYRFGIAPLNEAVVGVVDPLSPEAAAGLQSSDRIIALNHQEIYSLLDLSEALSDDPSLINLTVQRAHSDDTHEIHFSPMRSEQGTIMLQFSIQRSQVWRSGASITEASRLALLDLKELIGETMLNLGALLTGKLKAKNVIAGPIRISYLVGAMTSEGFDEGFWETLRRLLWTLGIIGLSLGVMNLLPIPALDGGFIIIALIELVRNKQLSPKAYTRLHTVGAFMIVLLLILALIGDISFLF